MAVIGVGGDVGWRCVTRDPSTPVTGHKFQVAFWPQMFVTQQFRMGNGTRFLVNDIVNRPFRQIRTAKLLFEPTEALEYASKECIDSNQMDLTHDINHSRILYLSQRCHQLVMLLSIVSKLCWSVRHISLPILNVTNKSFFRMNICHG